MPLLTCHCGPSRPILVLINEAVSSDSLGKRRAVFPFTEAAHVYLPTTDGPPGAPRGPQGSFALGILRLNQRTGSRAPSPDLQVTLAFYLLPKAVTYVLVVGLLQSSWTFLQPTRRWFCRAKGRGGKKSSAFSVFSVTMFTSDFFFFHYCLVGEINQALVQHL